MSPGARRLTVLVLLWGLPLGLAVGAAVWVSHAGMIAVNVEGHGPGGDRVHLVVPAVMVDMALQFIPESVCASAAIDMKRWGPVAHEFCRELSRCPDGVLVDVRGPRETTLIEKRGGSLVINVNSEKETVHVMMPLRTVAAVLSRLERSRLCGPVTGALTCPTPGPGVRL